MLLGRAPTTRERGVIEEIQEEEHRHIASTLEYMGRKEREKG